MKITKGQRQMQEIAAKLLEQTGFGNVEWRTSDHANTFLYSGPNSSILITRSQTGDGYSMQILNGVGRKIEELVSTELHDDEKAPWDVDETAPAPWNQTLGDLWEAARVSALNVERVIQETLNDLNALPPF